MNAYDEVPYTGRPYSDAHPERMATMAALHGVQAAPVERCRVLEVACGDAANLIPMAYAFPESEFVGFDLAAQPIEAGRQLAGRIGLTNLSLSQQDLAAFPDDGGRFDYIIAHGLYSWIPAPAREQLLALIARHLAPRGVAFVSYNVYPGCYIRRMVWEMLRFHTGGLEQPAERIAEARALARLLAERSAMDDAYTVLMREEFKRFAGGGTGSLFHDDLAEVNDPCYFHEFVAFAGRHRLQFLCEAELVATSYAGITPEARSVLHGMEPLAREQYLDFAKCRRFRQTLLCHEDIAVEREVGPRRVFDFRFASRRRASSDEPAVIEPPPQPEVALPQALLDALVAALPGTLSFDELAARVPGPDRGALAELCLAAAQVGAVQLHLRAPVFASSPGERPVASAVARVQSTQGENVTNLRHATVKLDDPLVRRLLPLLDGTRDLRALAAALGETADAIEGRLRQLAKLALLV